MAKSPIPLTLHRLKQVLSYDPQSGIFTWLVRSKNKVCAGNRAGYRATTGYIRIRIDGVMYLAHRLAWFYMTGEWPPDEIDHANCIRDDNRWQNLRPAGVHQNRYNRSKRRDNTSGFKGVSFDKSRCLWTANIRVDSRRIFLGRFASAEQAHEAYCAAAKENHHIFARTD